MTSQRRLPRRAKLASLLAVVGLVSAACGDGATEADDSAAAAQFASTQLDASVLSGTATTVSGESFDLAALGDKDLVVWFWAPW